MLWSILSGIFGASASSMIKLATSSSSSSTTAETMTTETQPFMYVQRYVCETQPWLVDLDETVLRGMYRFLGDLATGKYGRYLLLLPLGEDRINLMMYFKTFRETIEQMYATMFPYVFEVDYCQVTVIVPLRVCCIVMMVVLNAYMLASFLRGIQESGSVVGTALSTASNFITSVGLGAVVWNEHEHLTTTWYVGFSCVLLGVLLLSNVQPVVEDSNDGIKVDKTNNKLTKTSTTNGNQRHVPLSSKTSTTKDKEVIPRPKVSVRETVQSMNKSRSSNNNNNNSRVVDSNDNDNVSKAAIATSGSGTVSSSSSSSSFSKAQVQNQQSATTEKPASSVLSKTTYKKPKDLKHVSSLEQYYNESTRKSLSMTTTTATTITRPVQTPLIERGFLNECILCENQLFDTQTGDAIDNVAVADLSCSHVVHSSCLKQAAKSLNNACPICNKPLSMFTSTKQAASCSGFWVQRIEEFLVSVDGPPSTNNNNNNPTPQCLPASTIRKYFKELPDSVLSISQRQYIEDDPSGMDKGLQSALEWGGCRDYNNANMAQRGRLGYEESLRSQGIWRYDRKKDDVWLWGWGNVHPRQRCDQCQHVHGTTLSIHCDGCQGSSLSAHYCSEVCEKRDRQRHKITCQKWKSLNIPASC